MDVGLNDSVGEDEHDLYSKEENSSVGK